MCSVFLPDEDRTVSIAADHLKPVQPVRGDKVKVIMGKSESCFVFERCRFKIVLKHYTYCLDK